MKVVSVVGARPQFIKAAVLSPRLREVAQEVLVHTGQHYDPEMSAVFFESLPVPRPDYTLHAGSGSHGAQTGRMLEALDPILQKEAPNWVIVYGDTNSTLAGALAAAKMQIPVAHVESGLRSFNRAMPEEINRVVADHLAARLYCPTQQAVDNLGREGIRQGVVLSGDLMDVLVDRTPDDPGVFSRYPVQPGRYVLATVHRAQTTDDAMSLQSVLGALGQLPYPVLLPLHPRTRQKIVQFGLEGLLARSVIPVPAVGYRDMITLERHAWAVVTDSGGVQREACRLGVPTYILREETEWGELVDTGQAVLTGCDPHRIVRAVTEGQARPHSLAGLADPARLIIDDLLQEEL